MTIPEIYIKIKKDRAAAEQGAKDRTLEEYFLEEFGFDSKLTASLFNNPGRMLSGIGHKELETVAHLTARGLKTMSGSN